MSEADWFWSAMLVVSVTAFIVMVKAANRIHKRLDAEEKQLKADNAALRLLIAKKRQTLELIRAWKAQRPGVIRTMPEPENKVDFMNMHVN